MEEEFLTYFKGPLYPQYEEMSKVIRMMEKVSQSYNVIVPNDQLSKSTEKHIDRFLTMQQLKQMLVEATYVQKFRNSLAYLNVDLPVHQLDFL